MRNMSFALTTPQVLARTKTVTRRVGWEFLKAGDLIRAVEKSQGLKKGEKIRELAVIRVVDVRRERLDRMTTDFVYGSDECIAEGFAYWAFEPDKFVQMFCETHVIPDKRLGPPKGRRYRPPFPMLPMDEVTRIQFEYVDLDSLPAAPSSEESTTR